MAKVIVYTTKFCPYCVSAKSLLTSLKVPFEEIRLDDKPDLWEKLSRENKGWRTVPMIFAGEQFLGGFDDINTLHRKGELLPILTN